MTSSQRTLCIIYGLLALAGLVTTWSQNLAYADGLNVVGTYTSFLADTRVNPAARSITADIAILYYVLAVFMVLEGRRRGVRFIWAYIIGGLLIAISVTFPLFLIARERTLVTRPEGPGVGLPDLIGLALLGAAVAAMTAYVLMP